MVLKIELKNRKEKIVDVYLSKSLESRYDVIFLDVTSVITER